MALQTNLLELTDSLKSRLFHNSALTAFAVADGASVPQLLDHLYGPGAPTFECLYRGDLAPDMAEVAPYLIKLDAGSSFTDWLIQANAGNFWGIFLLASSDLRIVRQHLRRLLTVYQETNGQPLVFRFYDPRVLRDYLPSCNQEELTGFFGPVSEFWADCEGHETMLKFQFVSGALKTNEMKILEVPDALGRAR